MKRRFVVYTTDGREFRVTAYSQFGAIREVEVATCGRVTIDHVREIH